MKSKIVAAMLIYSSLAMAQLPVDLNSLISSPSQIMIEKAVGSGIILIREGYQLQDKKSKQFYGRNNQEEFGSSFSFGVLTCIGVIGLQDMVEPWKGDPNINSYKDKYIPVVSDFRYKSIADSASVKHLEFDTKNVETLNESHGIKVFRKKMEGRGLLFNQSGNYSDGWLVTLHADKPKDLEANLMINVQKNNVEIKSDQDLYPLKDVTLEDDVVGGVFLNPQSNQIGQIELCLSGILVKKDTKWNLVLIRNGEIVSSGITPIDNDTLTPIEKGEKRQKKDRKKTDKQ